MVDWIQPMEPISQPYVILSDDFIHQIKWDGIRGLSYIEKGSIRVFTKSGRERTGFYPELDEIPSLLKAKQAVLDGEIISLNDSGKPFFQLVQVRERVNDSSKVSYYAKKYPARYIVFDILMYDGKNLTHLPLKDRKAILSDVLRQSQNIAITDDFLNGEALFALMKEKSWEGIVSKRISSPYTGGKNHAHWYKTKMLKKLLAIVCGLSMKDNHPNSLILGIYQNQGFVYIGNASIGLTQEHFRLLKESIPLLETNKSTFNRNIPGLKTVIWLKPLLTCWVGFLEWTNDGSLRHPKILGFSSCKPEEANGMEFME